MIGKWTDKLPPHVYTRLCECRNTKSDIETLVNTRWEYMKEIGYDKRGFTREDALVYIIDILNANDPPLIITRGEYDALRKEK